MRDTEARDRIAALEGRLNGFNLYLINMRSIRADEDLRLLLKHLNLTVRTRPSLRLVESKVGPEEGGD